MEKGRQNYYFKITYQKLWQMLVYAITYFNTPVNRRLNPYYQQFLQYVLSLVALQDFDTWRDIARKLPANLLDETLYDFIDTWEELKNEGKKLLDDLSVFSEISNETIPDWLEEAIHNIDGWTREPINLDETLVQDAFQTLALNTKIINKQAKGKLILYKDGKAEFFAPTGRLYTCEIQRNTSEYKLLEFLSTNVGKLISVQKIGNKLKPPRRERNEVDYSRRVPNVVKAIKDKLNLPDIETLFIVNRGFYGLKFSVEIK